MSELTNIPMLYDIRPALQNFIDAPNIIMRKRVIVARDLFNKSFVNASPVYRSIQRSLHAEYLSGLNREEDELIEVARRMNGRLRRVDALYQDLEKLGLFRIVKTIARRLVVTVDYPIDKPIPKTVRDFFSMFQWDRLELNKMTLATLDVELEKVWIKQLADEYALQIKIVETE